MKTSEILHAAERALLLHGWHQGNFESPSGRVCTVGALMCVTADHEKHPLSLDAYHVLCQCAGTDHIARWNDEPTRTLPEVLALFAAAIAVAQEIEAHEENAVARSRTGETIEREDLAVTV